MVTVLMVVSFLIVLSALLVSVLIVVSFVNVSVLAESVFEVSPPLVPDLLWQAATENESASATKPILNEFFMV